jgi:tRNA-dihydrouridine synthase
VKDAVSIPLVANGDVGSPEDAANILRLSGADAVMVGRAHYGAPWLAGSIAAHEAGSALPDRPQTGQAFADYVISHYQDMLGIYGSESGVRQARKHLGWYLDRHAPATPAERRKTILTCFDPKTVIAELREAFLQAGDAEIVGLRSAA